MKRIQEITRDGKPFHLTHNQRNLYLYFLAHQRKNPHAPCFVPRCPMQGSYRPGESKEAAYIKIIQLLEDHNLFRVNRTGDSYMQWTLHPPEEQTNEIRPDPRTLAEPQDQVRHC